MNDVQIPRRKQALIITAKTILAGLALWLLFQSVHPDEVLAVMRSASWSGIGLALLGIPIHLSLRVVRWRILLKGAEEHDDLKLAARTVIVGYAMSQVTPGELGDFIARARIHGTIPAAKVIGLTMIDKVVHSSIVLLAGVPSLVLVATWSATGAAFALGVSVLVLITGFRMIPRTLRHSRIESFAVRFKFIEGIDAVRNVPRNTVIKVVLVTSLILLTYVVQEYFLINAVGSATPFQTWHGFWSGFAVRTAFPIFIAELGAREATHVWFFGLLGIPAATALSTSLLMFLVNIVTPSIAGLLVMLFGRKGAA